VSMAVPYANVLTDGASIAAVWLGASGIGAMIGNFAAVADKKTPEERAHWVAVGGAMGCAFGFLLMLCAIASLTRN